MPHTPAQDGHDQAAAAPHLRLRFDPPPAEPSPELDNVINEVEQLSLGIDTMLRRASESSVGRPGSAKKSGDLETDEDEDDALTHEDEPMMAMFDEEQPSDIHALDRMLASHADAAINADMIDEPSLHPADDAENESVETPSEEARPVEDVTLEGDFEDIGALIAGGSSSFIPPATDLPVPAHAASAAITTEHDPDPELEQEPEPEEQIAQQVESSLPSSSEELAIDAAPAPEAPPPVLDLSLAPTQAKGIAAALAAAAAGAHAPAPAASHQAAAHEPVHAAASTTESTSPETPVAAHSHVADSVVAAANAGAKAPPRHFASVGTRIVEIIALTNLPLRMVPKSMQPMVNLIAISLALWAPAVWALGPKIAAARHGTHAADAAHDDSHGAKSESSEKKSSASGKKSGSKTSSAKKAEAAATGGH